MIKTVNLSIHPTNPQQRLIDQAVAIIQKGGVIIYPTDSGYALGCQLEEKEAVERIRNIRKLGKDHLFTLICHNLSQLANYAHVDNINFRLLKAYTPGPYTFILTASKEVPRRLLHPKRKTIGLRVPDNKISLNLLRTLSAPLMSVTFFSEEIDSFDIDAIQAAMQGKVELIIDGGCCGNEPTTVLDLTTSIPKVVRMGKGKQFPPN